MKTNQFTLLQEYKNTTPLITETANVSDRRRHRQIAKNILSLAIEKGSNNYSVDEIAKVHECVHNILSLSQYRLSQHSGQTTDALINACISDDQPLEFVTIASGAVISGSFNPMLASKRIQYRLYDVIYNMLKNIPNLKHRSWRYTILLPLVSEDSYQRQSWEVNKDYIKTHTEVPVLYPQEFFSDSKTLQTIIEDNEYSFIQRKINQILNHGHIRSQFAVSEEKIKNDVRDYSLYGKYFEISQKQVILIDLQRKIYPYQQPCYRLLRKTPFAILPMHDLVMKTEKAYSTLESDTNA